MKETRWRRAALLIMGSLCFSLLGEVVIDYEELILKEEEKQLTTDAMLQHNYDHIA